jgi:hypothetical protein
LVCLKGQGIGCQRRGRNTGIDEGIQTSQASRAGAHGSGDVGSSRVYFRLEHLQHVRLVSLTAQTVSSAREPDGPPAGDSLKLIEKKNKIAWVWLWSLVADATVWINFSFFNPFYWPWNVFERWMHRDEARRDSGSWQGTGSHSHSKRLLIKTQVLTIEPIKVHVTFCLVVVD